MAKEKFQFRYWELLAFVILSSTSLWYAIVCSTIMPILEAALWSLWFFTLGLSVLGRIREVRESKRLYAEFLKSICLETEELRRGDVLVKFSLPKDRLAEFLREFVIEKGEISYTFGSTNRYQLMVAYPTKADLSFLDKLKAQVPDYKL